MARLHTHFLYSSDIVLLFLCRQQGALEFHQRFHDLISTSCPEIPNLQKVRPPVDVVYDIPYCPYFPYNLSNSVKLVVFCSIADSFLRLPEIGNQIIPGHPADSLQVIEQILHMSFRRLLIQAHTYTMNPALSGGTVDSFQLLICPESFDDFRIFLRDRLDIPTLFPMSE